MITLFAALSAGAKTHVRCNFSIFFFNDFTERLDGCLNKCGCFVKLSILMSIIRKNSFFQPLRACTPTPSFFDQRLQYDWSASSTISRHLVKSILDGSLYLGPFLKRDRNGSRAKSDENASLYTYTPTHANALQLLQMDSGRWSQSRAILQIDRLLDSSIYNESLMVHTIFFKGH